MSPILARLVPEIERIQLGDRAVQFRAAALAKSGAIGCEQAGNRRGSCYGSRNGGSGRVSDRDHFVRAHRYFVRDLDGDLGRADVDERRGLAVNGNRNSIRGGGIHETRGDRHQFGRRRREIGGENGDELSRTYGADVGRGGCSRGVAGGINDGTLMAAVLATRTLTVVNESPPGAGVRNQHFQRGWGGLRRAVAEL